MQTSFLFDLSFEYKKLTPNLEINLLQLILCQFWPMVGQCTYILYSGINTSVISEDAITKNTLLKDAFY